MANKKITQFKKAIKSAVLEMIDNNSKRALNEVQCPCFALGTNGATEPLVCSDGQGTMTAVTGCCGSNNGNAAAPMHPMCNGQTCTALNYSSDDCWTGNIVLPGEDNPIDREPLKGDDLFIKTKGGNLKPSIDRMVREAAVNIIQTINEAQGCNPPFMSNGEGNRCGAECDGRLTTLGGSPGGGGSGCICSRNGYNIGLRNSDEHCSQNVGPGGPGGVLPIDVRTGRTKGVAVRPTRPAIDPMDMMREAAKMMFAEEDLIGPKPKWAQDWLDNFNEFCNCPPPYAPCQCNGAVIPPGVPISIWKTLQPIATPDVIERLFLTDYSKKND